MKKVICILSVAAISLSGIAVFADDAGREYTSEGGYITIANEYGLKMYHDEYANYEYYPSVDGKNAALFYKSNKAKDVVVPAEINGVPVVEVRGRTGKKTGLESIAFPETVQTVEEFFEYTDLKSVSFSSGIKEIPRMAFKNCTALDNIEIPPSVEKIGGAAFDGCRSLKKLVLNEGLYVIGENAFTDCAIEQLELPSTLRKIERGAFLRNKALKELTITKGVESIGRGAFHLSGIEKLTFQSVPETVEDNAFGETPLVEVNGLQRKDMIRLWNAFNATLWQESMKDDAEPCLVDEDGRLVAYIGSSDDVVIPAGVKKIGSRAFTGKSITSVIIPETVNEIEETAFYECKQLTSVTIPAGVEKIGQMAFSNCCRLKNITFEYSAAPLSLGSSAFQFTLASPDTLVTNNRRYSNQKTAFQNTYFDPDYVPMIENGKYVDESYTEPPTAAPAADTKKAAEAGANQPYEAQGFAFAPGGAGNAVIGADGILYTWGLNGTDRWGYPDTESSGDVFRADMYDCAAVAQGGSHTLMLKEDGTMWGVGFNDHRQLLNPDKLYIPERVELMDNVKQITAGFQTSFAVTNDGKLFGWGLNAEGELGNGRTTESVAEPQEIMSGVKLVSAGTTHTAAIKNDDSLWTWGDNNRGELGDGGGIYRTKPVKIMDDVAFVDLGAEFTLILKNDGSVWSCGRNTEGQLGDGTKKNTNTPVKILDGAVSISAGDGIAAAIKADNSLWMWGYCGLGAIPVKNEISGRDDTEPCIDTPKKVMDDVYAVYAGNHTVYALKTDGILWGWGAAYGVETDPQEAVIDYSEAYIPRKLTDDVMLPSWRMPDANKEMIESAGPDVIEVKTGDTTSVELNGKAVAFPDAKPYIDENGRTQIPIRAVAEALGARVDWNGAERVATITKDNKVIKIAIGNNNMQVGNETIIMDTTAEIKDDRTYIPIRFVGEALGMQVSWVG